MDNKNNVNMSEIYRTIKELEHKYHVHDSEEEYDIEVETDDDCDTSDEDECSLDSEDSDDLTDKDNCDTVGEDEDNALDGTEKACDDLKAYFWNSLNDIGVDVWDNFEELLASGVELERFSDSLYEKIRDYMVYDVLYFHLYYMQCQRRIPFTTFAKMALTMLYGEDILENKSISISSEFDNIRRSLGKRQAKLTKPDKQGKSNPVYKDILQKGSIETFNNVIAYINEEINDETKKLEIIDDTILAKDDHNTIRDTEQYLLDFYLEDYEGCNNEPLPLSIPEITGAREVRSPVKKVVIIKNKENEEEAVISSKMDIVNVNKDYFTFSEVMLYLVLLSAIRGRSLVVLVKPPEEYSAQKNDIVSELNSKKQYLLMMKLFFSSFSDIILHGELFNSYEFLTNYALKEKYQSRKDLHRVLKKPAEKVMNTKESIANEGNKEEFEYIKIIKLAKRATNLCYDTLNAFDKPTEGSPSCKEDFIVELTNSIDVNDALETHYLSDRKNEAEAAAVTKTAIFLLRVADCYIQGVKKEVLEILRMLLFIDIALDVNEEGQKQTGEYSQNLADTYLKYKKLRDLKE